MSTPSQPSKEAAGTPPAASNPDFREALAQWRLQVHTEVKRVSSLPTAMFDATDPMLEMQLAESTEAMLQQLQVPGHHLLSPDNEDRRLEVVDAESIRSLPKRFAQHEALTVDLLSNLNAEYFGVLADMCCTQEGAVRDRAVDLICSDFGVTSDGIDEAVDDLWRMTESADREADNDRDPEDLATQFAQVTGAVRTRLQPTATDSNNGPRP